MNDRCLIVRVHMHQPRFHGTPDWPPSPARLFQALVAGAARRLHEPAVVAAFGWLEALAPPAVAFPTASLGQARAAFVPNNDLDSEGGDPSRIDKIRVARTTQPRLFAANQPFVYVWGIDDNEAVVEEICHVAKELFQLGRGIDPAWATAAVVAREEAERELRDHPGDVLRPTPGAPDGLVLQAPRQGSLQQLNARFSANQERIQPDPTGNTRLHHFTQPPRPFFRDVLYGGTAMRLLFDLRELTDRGVGPFAARNARGAHALTVRIRDAAIERLTEVMPERASTIVGVLKGTPRGERAVVSQDQRAHLMPLPSIGSRHADHGVRRVVVVVPANGPLALGDIAWAFSGLSVPGVGLLAPAESEDMLARYVKASTRWQSVTPLALPVSRTTGAVAASAEARARDEVAAREAVVQALRHAGVRGRTQNIVVQREPWDQRGTPAPEFAVAPRFPAANLWHVRLDFQRPVAGPLALGNGRYVGLGIMQPCILRRPAVMAWDIVCGLNASPDPEQLCRALRRATLSLAQREWSKRRKSPLPATISGHRSDGGPAEGHQHLYYQYDQLNQRLLVFTGNPGDKIGWPVVVKGLRALRELRAGRQGRLGLVSANTSDYDPLIAASHQWVTQERYRVNRHRDAGSVQAAVEDDVREACRQAGLPQPAKVVVTNAHSRPGVGLEADIALHFATAVSGPIALGKTAHRGGGLFTGG